jgi:hypothetical protein
MHLLVTEFEPCIQRPASPGGRERADREADSRECMDTIFAECAPRMKSRCLALVEEVVQCPSYKIVARFQSRAPSCVPVCGGGRKCGVKIMGDPCCVRVWGAGDFSCAVRASDAPLNPRSSLERSPTKTRRISTDCLRPSTDRSPHVPKARRRARPSGESTRMIPLRRTCTTASARQVYQARRSDEPESASSAERKRRQFFISAAVFASQVFHATRCEVGGASGGVASVREADAQLLLQPRLVYERVGVQVERGGRACLLLMTQCCDRATERL